MPTPAATARSRSSTAGVTSVARGTRRVPRAAHHIGVDGHADFELVQHDLSGHDQAAVVRDRLDHGLGDRRGKSRRGLVDELRGLIGNASLRHVPVELHRRPQDGGADLFRLPG